MNPPAELIGGLATMWLAGADDSVIDSALRTILEDNSWPSGRNRLLELTTPELRAEFVEMCHGTEAKQIEEDPELHNHKRAKTYYF